MNFPYICFGATKVTQTSVLSIHCPMALGTYGTEASFYFLNPVFYFCAYEKRDHKVENEQSRVYVRV